MVQVPTCRQRRGPRDGRITKSTRNTDGGRGRAASFVRPLLGAFPSALDRKRAGGFALKGVSEGRIAIFGSLLALCSFGPFYVTPNYLLALQTAHGFSLDQLGYISGSENFLIAIACTVAAFNVRHIGWRTMLAATLVCVAGNLLSIFVTDFPSVLAVRALVRSMR